MWIPMHFSLYLLQTSPTYYLCKYSHITSFVVEDSSYGKKKSGGKELSSAEKVGALVNLQKVAS